MGEPSDTSTSGGGHVQIYVDSITIFDQNQTITADGLPNKDKYDRDNLNGGTGGYIYIKTYNKFSNNSIEGDALISARGGFGINNGLGGAGGVVVLDGNFSRDNILTNFKVAGG